MLKTCVSRSVLLVPGLALAHATAAQDTPVYPPSSTRLSLARLLLRHNLPVHSLLFAGYEMASPNYSQKLRNAFATPNNPEITSLELHQIDLKFRLRYEHELLSSLWTGSEAGYCYNYLTAATATASSTASLAACPTPASASSS